jgi:hypothetical protein
VVHGHGGTLTGGKSGGVVMERAQLWRQIRARDGGARKEREGCCNRKEREWCGPHVLVEENRNLPCL